MSQVFEITALCNFLLTKVRHFSSEIGAFCGTLPTFNLSSNFFFFFFLHLIKEAAPKPHLYYL